MPDFAALPLLANIAIFAVCAVCVWVAGTRLSYCADAIARTTGIGQAALGVLLLGGVTSMPEIAVTGTAAAGGNSALAVNNLLGGFTMQVAILAIADAVYRKGALTSAVPDPIVMLQGTLGIILVALIVAGIAVGDIAFAGAGVWTWLIFIAFLYSLRLVVRTEGNPSWEVIGQPPAPEIDAETDVDERSLRRLIMQTTFAAAVILVAGFLLSKSGEALADQTGLGSSFFGAVFVAIATSLPEVSTVLAAMRLRRYVMAMSDIFGTNLFDIALIFLVDVIYVGPPVLTQVGGFSILAGCLGIIVTALYLAGLIERRDPAVLGVGLDSILVAIVYVGGVALLFGLR